MGESVAQVSAARFGTHTGFHILYANANGHHHQSYRDPGRRSVRRWTAGSSRGFRARSRPSASELDNYDTTAAGGSIATFVDDLSNWYVRRSRRRFWKTGSESTRTAAAFLTLHESLVDDREAARAVTPFVAEEIYTNLDGGREHSVHLCDFPEPDESLVDRELEDDMALARDGRARPSRAQSGEGEGAAALARGAVVADEREREAIARLGTRCSTS